MVSSPTIITEAEYRAKFIDALNGEAEPKTLLQETMSNLYTLVNNCASEAEARDLKEQLSRPVGVLCSRFNLPKSNLAIRERNKKRRAARHAKSNAYEG